MSDNTRNEDVLRQDRCPKDFHDYVQDAAARIRRRPVNRWERSLMAVLSAASVCGVGVCAVLLLKAGFVTTANQRFVLLLALLFAAAAAFWCWSVLKRGYYRALQPEMPYAVWIFCTAVICVEIFTKQGERTLLTSIAGVVLIGFVMTWDRIVASEMRVRESVLRIALELCNEREMQPPDCGDNKAA